MEHVLVTASLRLDCSAGLPDTVWRAEPDFSFELLTLVIRSWGPSDGEFTPPAFLGIAKDTRRGFVLSTVLVRDPGLAPALNPAATGAATLADRARVGGSRGSTSPNARGGREALGWYVAAGFVLTTGWGFTFSLEPRHHEGRVTSGGRGAPMRESLCAIRALCVARAPRVEVNEVDPDIVRVD